MSSPITPVPGATGSTSPMSMPIMPSGDISSFAAELDAVERGIAVDAHTHEPPAKLLDEMAGAACLHDRLAAEGVHLSFSAAGAGARSRITLQDAAGSSEDITTGVASEIACGRLPG